jgi:cobalt-zinc-cadmium efflux system membrane fusion protein
MTFYIAVVKKQKAPGRPFHRAHSASLLTAALLLSMALAACHPAGAERAAAPAPMLVRDGDKISVPADSPLRSRLAVAAVAGAGAAHVVDLPAVVEADPARTVNIMPPLTGRLMALKVGLGDTVRQGQVLALIASPDLAQAYADADKAADAKQLAERALQRARGVYEAGANASRDLEQVQSNAAQAEAESNRAQARLKALGATATPGRGEAAHALVLTAPVSGTVTALNGGVGSFLNDPTAALMTIANLDQVWVTVNVPESQSGAVVRGQQADVRLAAWPGQVRHGAVVFVSPVLDPDTRRAKARIAFVNTDGKLKPNMYASVSLATAPGAGSSQASAQVSVPASALLMNNDATTVFVEVAPWTFVRRAVETGSEDGDTVRIAAGLTSGERIVVRGGVLLND